MERRSQDLGAGGPGSFATRFGLPCEPLLYGDIATDEVIRPGQPIQLWMIVTNVGETSAREDVRLSVRRVDDHRAIVLECCHELTIPPGERRVAFWKLSMSEIAVPSRGGRPATAAAGEFEFIVAPPASGVCRRAIARLAADWVGELAEVV